MHISNTVYPKKYAHGFFFPVLCCGYTLTDFPISIRLTSLALWQSNDCPSASKAILMNMDKYFMWIHYERLHNHNKAKHNKTVCIFLGIYCMINLESVEACPLHQASWSWCWLSSLRWNQTILCGQGQYPWSQMAHFTTLGDLSMCILWNQHALFCAIKSNF